MKAIIIMAKMTDFQILFRNTLYKITDDIDFINAKYNFARTNEHRQEIIDKINAGKLKTKKDISELVITYSPYKSIEIKI